MAARAQGAFVMAFRKAHARDREGALRGRKVWPGVLISPCALIVLAGCLTGPIVLEVRLASGLGPTSPRYLRIDP